MQPPPLLPTAWCPALFRPQASTLLAFLSSHERFDGSLGRYRRRKNARIEPHDAVLGTNVLGGGFGHAEEHAWPHGVGNEAEETTSKGLLIAQTRHPPNPSVPNVRPAATTPSKTPSIDVSRHLSSGSAGSAIIGANRGRLLLVGSCPTLSSGSPLGPPPIASTGSRGSSGSGVTGSKWGQKDLEGAGCSISPQRRTIDPLQARSRVLGERGGKEGSGWEETKEEDFSKQGLATSEKEAKSELKLPIWATAADAEHIDDRTVKIKGDLMREPAGVPHFELKVGSASEPEMDTPVFHANVLDENENLVDDVTSEESDHSKKSFDFTGELNKLNEPGASDRQSFVEQLEKAFKTPVKIDLRCDFGNGFLHAGAPPLPPLPSVFSKQPVPEDVSTSYEERGEISVSSTDVQACTSTQGPSVDLKPMPLSQLLDHKEPTLLPGSDGLSSPEVTHKTDVCVELPRPLRTSTSTSSSRCCASDGELNRSFKFGGVVPKPSIEKGQEQDEPLTLSDIIPPPSRARALSTTSSEADDSVLKSIMEKAAEVPPHQAAPRLNPDSSTRRRTRNRVQPVIQYRHSRHESGISFTSSDSFEEVSRGFEFHDHRPGFCPPSANNSRLHAHSRQESTRSFALISSYGHVLNNSVAVSFGYSLPSLQERPSSEDLSSISVSVGDTFSFMHHDSYRRRRIESDASSFYFNPSNLRGHRHQDSNMPVVSQAPPSAFTTEASPTPVTEGTSQLPASIHRSGCTVPALATFLDASSPWSLR
ncbi:hypothetical protein PM082_023301 [Marasmius tenuissimus]|nr:hypothetical protein PM082_023301 [Marasmius tenuissimus]